MGSNQMYCSGACRREHKQNNFRESQQNDFRAAMAWDPEQEKSKQARIAEQEKSKTPEQKAKEKEQKAKDNCVFLLSFWSLMLFIWLCIFLPLLGWGIMALFVLSMYYFVKACVAYNKLL